MPPKNINIYQHFATIYDRVMRDIDYNNWTNHILSLADEAQIDTGKILNLACGTGSLDLIMLERGYNLTSLDQSEDMLKEAREKALDEDLEGRFIQGRMENFDLGETFSMVLCLYDSLNYLLTEKEVEGCFAAAFRHLKPGGGFIFDVTTEHNILTNFADYTYAENLPTGSYIWENDYNHRKKLCASKLTMFLPEGDHYLRYEEVHRQRLFEIDFLEGALLEAGFKVRHIFDGFSTKPPDQKCERVHFVALKD